MRIGILNGGRNTRISTHEGIGGMGVVDLFQKVEKRGKCCHFCPFVY